MPIIRYERPADVASIRKVHRAAFGQDGEAALVDALRDGGFVRLALVAEVDGQVVGHILFSELAIVSPERTVPGLSLAPLAVLPAFQRRGIGTQLTEHALELCREAGHQIVVVLGHPNFYARFGFSAALAQPLASPYAGEAWMALELVPGSLTGVASTVHYPPPFQALS